MYTHFVFLLDHYLCRHAKLNLMDSRQRVIYFLKTKPHRWFTHTPHIYILYTYEIKHIFYNLVLYLCRIHVLLYIICALTEEYGYNVLINVMFRYHLSNSAHTQIMYNHNN